GLVNRGVLEPFAIYATRNGPEIVATTNDRLARSETLSVRIAERYRNHCWDSRFRRCGSWSFSNCWLFWCCRSRGSGFRRDLSRSGWRWRFNGRSIRDYGFSFGRNVEDKVYFGAADDF